MTENPILAAFAGKHLRDHRRKILLLRVCTKEQVIHSSFITPAVTIITIITIRNFKEF